MGCTPIASNASTCSCTTMVEISERAAREIKPALAAVTAEIKAKVAAGADPVTTTYEVIEAKRSEIRPAPEAPAKPEPKPEVQVKPKKGEPTIESLQAENAQLREALAEARDNARELAAMVESYDAVTQGEHAQFDDRRQRHAGDRQSESDDHVCLARTETLQRRPVYPERDGDVRPRRQLRPR